jgi:hypothetical protein
MFSAPFPVLVPMSAEMSEEFVERSNGKLKPDFTLHWFIFLRALAMRFEKAPVLIDV